MHKNKNQSKKQSGNNTGKKFSDSVKDASKKVSESIKSGAKKTGSAVKTGSKKVGAAVKSGAKKTSEFFKNTTKKASEAIKKGSKKTVESIKNTNKKTSESLKNFGKATKEKTRGASKKVTGYVKSLNWTKVKEDFSKVKDVAFKYNKRDRKNSFGLILAIVLVFLAIVVPIMVNNQEIEEAKAAAAEAQRIAFEEARQAAIEAEKKAEEERLAAINAALTQQAATAAEEKAAKEAAEKAAKEREELVASIDERLKQSVTQIVEDSSSEDFKTQYEIQNNLLDSQDSASTSYEKFVSNLLSAYDEKYENLLDGINGTVDSVNTHVDAVNTHVDAINDHVDVINEHVDSIKAQMEADKAAEEAEKQAKYDSHYSRTNRVDLDFAFKAVGVEYSKKFKNSMNVGGKLEYDFGENTAFAFATAGYTFKDWFEGNIGIEAEAGLGYDFANKELDLAAGIAGVFRYTVHDGFELVFRPEILVKNSVTFKNVKVCYFPLSFGVSLVF